MNTHLLCVCVCVSALPCVSARFKVTLWRRCSEGVHTHAHDAVAPKKRKWRQTHQEHKKSILVHLNKHYYTLHMYTHTYTHSPKSQPSLFPVLLQINLSTLGKEMLLQISRRSPPAALQRISLCYLETLGRCHGYIWIRLSSAGVPVFIKLEGHTLPMTPPIFIFSFAASPILLCSVYISP